MKFALILLALPLYAAPNFSGTWTLDLGKSQYGQVPAPQAVTKQIRHNDPALSISTRQQASQGTSTTEVKYTTDSKPAVNKIASGESHGTARWQGDSLVIESSVEAQGAQLKQREVWTLSADGKTLTIAIHLTLPNGEFDVKQVFEKL